MPPLSLHSEGKAAPAGPLWHCPCAAPLRRGTWGGSPGAMSWSAYDQSTGICSWLRLYALGRGPPAAAAAVTHLACPAGTHLHAVGAVGAWAVRARSMWTQVWSLVGPSLWPRQRSLQAIPKGPVVQHIVDFGDGQPHRPPAQPIVLHAQGPAESWSGAQMPSNHQAFLQTCNMQQPRPRKRYATENTELHLFICRIAWGR